MAISLDQLRTFLTVYRTGSVTRAASLLEVAQSTVTAQVRALEEALDRPLFERLPRGMAPTAAAEQLARSVSGSLDELDRLLTGTLTGDPEGTLAQTVHLGGPAELVSERVLPALADLVVGGLTLRITLGLPDDLLAALAHGSLDVVISTTRPRHRGIHAEPLYDEVFVLVAAAEWAQRVGEEPTPADLTRVPLVAYAENLPIIRRYWRSVFGMRLTRPAAVVVPDLRGVLAAVVAGAGMTVLPRYLCVDQLTAGTLRPLLEPEVPPLNTIFLARRAGVVHPAADAVRDRLTAVVGEWPS